METTRTDTRGMRVIVVLAVLAIAAWLWAGRADRAGGGPTPVSPEKTSSTVRELRFGLNIAAGSALHAAAEKFAEQVNARAQGKLRVTVHPNQQLGSDDQMIEMARNGQLDLLLVPTAKLSAAVPAMQYADLPFYFAGREELYAMLDGEPGNLLLAKLKRIDLVGLTFWENGFKQFTANTPIRTPADFAGLRVRTMKSPLIAEQFSAMGAKPIPIDFHATYQALKDGAVDAQENPLVAIVGMRFHEVQKHLSLSNHAYLGYVFVASSKVFESLAPPLRDLLHETAREMTAWERAETVRREADFIRQIEAAGVQVHALSEAERVAFGRAMAPVSAHFGFDVGYDLIAKTEELRYLRDQAARAGRDKAPIVIGLDADLSARGAWAGGAIYRGIELAIADINRQGGVLGRPLQLLARDHGANAPSSVDNLTRLAAMPEVVAVVGGMHSGVIGHALAPLHRLGMPFLIPWASSLELTRNDRQPNYVFRVSLTDDLIAPFLLRRALKKFDRVVVMVEESTWGRSNEAECKKVVAQLPKGKSVQFAHFANGDPLLQGRVADFARSDVEAIVFIGNGIEAGVVVDSLGREPRALPVFAHWALLGHDFFGSHRDVLKKVEVQFVQSIVMDETEAHQPALSRLLAAYRQRYGVREHEPMVAPFGTMHAYDAVQLLARAVAQAGSTDRAAVRNALERLKPYEGVMQRYAPAFTPTDHDALDEKLLHLARFDADGRIVFAE